MVLRNVAKLGKEKLLFQPFFLTDEEEESIKVEEV